MKYIALIEYNNERYASGATGQLFLMYADNLEDFEAAWPEEQGRIIGAIETDDITALGAWLRPLKASPPVATVLFLDDDGRVRA